MLDITLVLEKLNALNNFARQHYPAWGASLIDRMQRLIDSLQQAETVEDQIALMKHIRRYHGGMSSFTDIGLEKSWNTREEFLKLLDEFNRVTRESYTALTDLLKASGALDETVREAPDKQIPKHEWLYPENARFASGELDTPVNQAEIIASLKAQYWISDDPLPTRLIKGSTALLLGLLTVAFILFWITSSILPERNILSLICSVAFVGPFIYAVYLCFRYSYRLLPHRINKVQYAWQALVSEGKILSGNVMRTQNLALNKTALRYEFYDQANKRTAGWYNYNAFPFSLVEKEVLKLDIPDPAAFNFHPEQVKVWYVNHKIHTLL